jgi:hypothetical protein
LTDPVNQSNSVSRSQAEVLQIARRETSLDHVHEFEPITKGFVFAVLALAPLGLMAAFGLVWKKLFGRRV